MWQECAWIYFHQSQLIENPAKEPERWSWKKRVMKVATRCEVDGWVWTREQLLSVQCAMIRIVKLTQQTNKKECLT